MLAAIEAMSQPPFNLDGINATTHPCAVFVLVSGPAARAAGSAWWRGLLWAHVRAERDDRSGRPPGAAQTWPARPLVGGDRATQGTPAKFAFCAAEREDASPWPPFQTTRGLEPEQGRRDRLGLRGAAQTSRTTASNTAEGILQTIAGAMGQAGSNNILGKGEPVLAFGPEHAATVADEGITREEVQEYLWEHARFPASRLSPEFLSAVNDRMGGGELPTHAVDDSLPITDRPEEIHIIVAGGPGKHSCWMPTFGGMTRPVTVPLR